MIVVNKEKMIIKPIDKKETYEFILNKHYAQRKPSISFAFGLFIENRLEGILTIGKPASNSLCESVCGKEYKEFVYELNRLCVNDGLEKNTLSYFVGEVLRQLKCKKIILVSYADTGMGHHGYIYQATNWLYTGATKKQKDKYAPNGKHSRHAKDYDDFFKHLRVIRTIKHRYIFIPNKQFRKECLNKLNFEILPYPKGDNERYILGEKMKRTVINIETNEVFEE